MHHPATRVLIAEDHELFRRGLTELLEGEGFQVVGTAARAEEAISLARVCSPDVTTTLPCAFATSTAPSITVTIVSVPTTRTSKWVPMAEATADAVTI